MNPKHYYSDEPCLRGHIGPRLLSTRACIECTRDHIKRWRANPENRRREAVQSAITRKAKGYYYHEQAKTRMREYYRKKKGIPSAPYPAPANCENCNRAFKNGHDTHLDHDHITGKFRGWLCNRCNRGFGYFGDTLEGMKQGVRYLERAEEINK